MGVEAPNNVRNVERMKTDKHTKLNAWRALKDLEPVQSWKCRLGWIPNTLSFARLIML
jgi:hypothetical protein